MGEEGVAFVFNTPNRKSGAGYRKMGWRTVGRLPLYARPLRPAVPLRRTVPRGPGSAAPPAPLRPVSELLARPETERFLAELDRRRAADSRLRTVASLAYLSWRYASVPGLDYRACWAGDGEDAAALVVRMRRRRGLSEASVSEILAGTPAGVDTAARLLRGLGAATAAHYAAAVATPGTGEHAALLKAGFLRLPNLGPRLLARPLGTGRGPNDPGKLDAWRLTTGTFELF